LQGLIDEQRPNELHTYSSKTYEEES
jgi:hypothetical protein